MSEAPKSDGPLTDYQTTKRDVLASLREVAELADDAGAATLADRLRTDRIPRLTEERFHLVVLGEFNHGKTTFVNALLGAPVLPTGVTPTTAIIHHVRHGDKPRAKVVANDGGEKELPVEQVADYVVGGKAPQDSTRYLEVGYPAAIVEGGVVLVDTPGVNDLNLSRAEVTYSYLPRADAILFLLDAGQILKESERSFIANKLLKQSRDKVMFVINKIDLLDDDERSEALAYAHSHLSRLVEDPKVYAVSAQRALSGEVEQSGINELTEDLRTFLRDERGRVLLDNALDEGLRTAGTLKVSVQIQRQALEMDQEDLDRRLASLELDLNTSAERAEKREAQIRESLAAVKALVRRETVEFGKRFALALPGEIEGSKAEDLKRYLPAFMEERFKKFAEQQGEDVATRLEKVAEEAIAFVSEDARERADRLKEVLGQRAPEVDLTVNTLAYDVGVIALGTAGLGVMALSGALLVGGAMIVAAPVLAYFFRGRADREMKKRAMEEAPEAVRDAAKRLADGFDDQIDKFGDRLLEFVRSANSEMTQSITEVVRKVKAARTEGADEIDDLEQTVGVALGRLKAVVDRMEGLRTGLWANGSSTPAASARADN